MAKWCSIQGTEVPGLHHTCCLQVEGFFLLFAIRKYAVKTPCLNTLNVKFMGSLSYNLLNMETNLCDSTFMGK